MTEASHVHARNRNQDDDVHVHVRPSCNCKLSKLDRSLPHQAELHLNTYPPSEMMLVSRLNADQNEPFKHRDAMNSPHAVCPFRTNPAHHVLTLGQISAQHAHLCVLDAAGQICLGLF
jgi:hypothetical protein